MMDQIIVGRKGDHVPSYEAIYIGRGSALGNPFKMVDESRRDQVIEQFRQHLWIEIKSNPDGAMNTELMRISRMIKCGKKIMIQCFCKPKACHGDVIKRAIEWLIKNNMV